MPRRHTDKLCVGSVGFAVRTLASGHVEAPLGLVVDAPASTFDLPIKAMEPADQAEGIVVV